MHCGGDGRPRCGFDLGQRLDRIDRRCALQPVVGRSARPGHRSAVIIDQAAPPSHVIIDLLGRGAIERKPIELHDHDGEHVVDVVGPAIRGQRQQGCRRIQRLEVGVDGIGHPLGRPQPLGEPVGHNGQAGSHQR